MRLLNYKAKNIRLIWRMAGVAVMTGLFSTLIAGALKVLTEHYEHRFYEYVRENKAVIFILPLGAFVSILWLKRYLFSNKPNLGIREILDGIRRKNHSLASYKIPMHFFNGFLTVISGGSTGIEVSTVVASASVGAVSCSRQSILRKYKTEMVCAGVAAGLTALFNAPVAGLLFALEIFMKRISGIGLFCILIAITTAFFMNHYFFETVLFHFQVSQWNSWALPYFILLGFLSGLHAVYLTKSVLFFKKLSGLFRKNYQRFLFFSMLISLAVFFLPALYGDGYIAIDHVASYTLIPGTAFLITIVAILLLKPLITAATLGAGGDGGVFAPSLFLGAFLGLLVAYILNRYFHVEVIMVNFIVIGMAAVLSGSIHAPFTAIFLVCAIVGNYNLFIPILLACLVARVTSGFLYPYTVYTYSSAK
ncbi:MAG: chloride channel protein [Bacteroidetes bacterium]|nr:chloride channel protein [Bacteroidota bacterium]